MTIQGFACKGLNGMFVGIDQSSGGYPYYSDRLADVHIFPTLDEAERYARMFRSYQDFQFTVVPVSLRLEELNQATEQMEPATDQRRPATAEDAKGDEYEDQ